MHDEPFAAAVGVFSSTCLLLLVSGFILVQCCGCCKKKGKVKKQKSKAPKGGGAKKAKDKNNVKKSPHQAAPQAMPHATPAANKDMKPMTTEGPKLQVEGKQQGTGVGQDYQTLGNINRDIFLQGGQQPPAQHQNFQPPPAQAPASIQNVPQSMNDAGGGDDGGPDAGQARAGTGQGADYQTWNNLDQAVFVKNGTASAPHADAAPASAFDATPAAASELGGDGQSRNEAAPQEGLGQGPDYQTWNNLDPGVFAANQ